MGADIQATLSLSTRALTRLSQQEEGTLGYLSHIDSMSVS